MKKPTKKTVSKLLVSAAVTGLMVGMTLPLTSCSGDTNANASAKERNGCNSPNGCSSKNSCKSKSSCNSPNGCNAAHQEKKEG